MTVDTEELRGQRDTLRALVVAAGFRNIDDLLSRPDRLEVARAVGKEAKLRQEFLRARAQVGW